MVAAARLVAELLLSELKHQIGAGGIGEVYRATDTKLGRDVARDPDRLAHFEREARSIAAINSFPQVACASSKSSASPR